MSLLDKLGYDKNEKLISLGESALNLSDIIITEINNDFNDYIIEKAYYESQAYGEGLFNGDLSASVRSTGRYIKELAADGWQMLKDLFKKAMDMMKNILKEFFNQEKHLMKYITDIKKALNDRSRNIKSEERIMEVITYESLAEAKIPIHAALEDSYTVGILTLCDLLDKVHGQGEFFDYQFLEWKYNNPLLTDKDLSLYAFSEDNGISLNGKGVRGKYNLNIVKNMSDTLKRIITKFREKFRDKNKLNEQATLEWLTKEIKGEGNLTNREWRSLLDSLAKCINSGAGNYMDVSPDSIKEFCKFTSSYGLYMNEYIGTEKEATRQKNELHLVKFEKKKVSAPNVFELTTNMLSDFLDLFNGLNAKKLSRYFRQKEKNLDMLMNKIDSLKTRVQNAQSKYSNNTQDFNNSKRALVDQGKNEASDMSELFRDINNFGFGEALFNNNENSSSNSNNRNSGGNPTAQTSDNPDDTANMIPYIKSYIVGYSQGTMQAGTFYNMVLRKYFEACRSTLITYYAVTSRKGEEDRKREDFDVSIDASGKGGQNRNRNADNGNNNE